MIKFFRKLFSGKNKSKYYHPSDIKTFYPKQGDTILYVLTEHGYILGQEKGWPVEMLTVPAIITYVHPESEYINNEHVYLVDIQILPLSQGSMLFKRKVALYETWKTFYETRGACYVK